jgi:glutaredoxin
VAGQRLCLTVFAKLSKFVNIKNMKKSIHIIFFSILLIIVILAFVAYRNKTNQLNNIILSMVENKTFFFYGDGCPHCVNVEKFFQDNNVESKVQFDKKEVFNNKQNSYLMTTIATKKCNISESNLGVPFLWDGPDSKCVLGDQDIINFFKQKLGI